MTVIAQGNRIVQKINDLEIVDFTDLNETERSLSGLLALKFWRNQGPLKVQFKDVRLKKLSAAQTAAPATSAKPVWRVHKSLDQWPVLDPQQGSTVTKEPGGGFLMRGRQSLESPGVCLNVLIQARVKKVSGVNLLMGLRLAPKVSYFAWFNGGKFFGIKFDGGPTPINNFIGGQPAKSFDDFFSMTFVAFGDRCIAYADNEMVADVTIKDRKGGNVWVGAIGDSIFQDVKVMEAPAGIASI